jgi:rSAM-associated Gly-rich repeat protein
MAYIPRSGLFGFLLLLAALAPSAGMAASQAAPALPASQSFSNGQVEPAAADSIEGRLRRISAALRARDWIDPAAPQPADSSDGKLALTFVNGPAVGFRNGGFRNGGWGNGGFRNGGFGNGGFRNGGWGNGGGFRNGGFLNRW